MLNQRKEDVRRRKSTGVKFNVPTEGNGETNFGSIGPIEVIKPSPELSTKGQLSKKSWSPARGIKKFNFDDLPSLATLTDEIFKDDVAMTNALASVLEEPKSEYGGIGLTKNRARKVTKRPKGETAFGDSSARLRNDLLKVSAQIKGDLEANIGFGFRSTVKKKSPGGGSNPQVDLGGYSAPVESNSKMVDKSITALQSRIQEQRRKFQEYQTGSLKLPSKELPNILPGIGKLLPTTTVPKKSQNFLIRKKAQENAKLNEIARIFRQSLEASAKNPNEVIRLPGREKSPAKNPSQVTKGSVVTKSPAVGKLFLGKPKVLVNKGQSQTSSSGGLMELRQLLNRGHPNYHADESDFNPIPNPLEFAKKKSEELDEPLGFRRDKTKAPSVQFAEYLETMDKDREATDVSGGLGHRDKSIGYSTLPNELFQKKLSESVKTIDEAGTVAKNLGSLMTRVASTRSPSKTVDVVPNSPVLKSAGVNASELAKSLGLKFDVTSILDATTSKQQQTQLLKLTEEMGGLMSAAARSGDDGFAFPNEELFQNKKSLKMKPDTGPNLPAPRVSGTRAKQISTATETIRAPPPKGKTIEIQTDKVPATTMTPSTLHQPMKFLLPEIQFTKDMSEKDQEMLLQLRAMKSKWENYSGIMN